MATEISYIKYNGVKCYSVRKDGVTYDGITINGVDYRILKTYAITVTTANATASESNPTTIKENGTATLTFTADDGYNLPDSITVTGATLDSWDSETGEAVISNPTDDVTVTVTAEAAAEPLTASPTSISFGKSNMGEDHTNYYETATVTLSGGTGTYTPSVSSSIASFTNGYASTNARYVEAAVTATVSGSTMTLKYSITKIGSSYPDNNSISGSGTVTVTSGDESVTITVTISDDWTCLTGDMLITMSDGTQKRVDSLSVGEHVLSFNPETMQLEPDEIIYSDSNQHKHHTEYDIWTFSDGTQIKTVHRHRFYNIERRAMVNMDEWHIGEHTYRIDGKVVELIRHENVKQEVNHYTLFTKNQNYFVNGVLSGNKYTKELRLNEN